MAYFGGASRMAGDPGLFDTLRNIGRAIIPLTPLGGPIAAATTFFKPGGRFPIPRRGGRAPVLEAMPDGTVRRKRRRTNFGNIKALKRAMRRQDGFVKVAKKALEGSNFTVVSRASQATARAKASAAKAIAAAHHAG